MCKLLLLLSMCCSILFTTSVYCWPEVGINKETQAFIEKMIREIKATSVIPKALPPVPVAVTIDAQGLEKALHAIPKTLPTIPVAITTDTSGIQKTLHDLPVQIGHEFEQATHTLEKSMTQVIDHTHKNIDATITRAQATMHTLPQTYMESLKNIPIMSLGFIGAFYALQLLRNNMQEFALACQSDDQHKQRSLLTWSAINTVCLIVCIATIAKSNAIIAVFA